MILGTLIFAAELAVSYWVWTRWGKPRFKAYIRRIARDEILIASRLGK